MSFTSDPMAKERASPTFEGKETTRTYASSPQSATRHNVKRVLVTLHLPLDASCVAQVLLAVSRDYPEAVISYSDDRRRMEITGLEVEP